MVPHQDLSQMSCLLYTLQQFTEEVDVGVGQIHVLTDVVVRRGHLFCAHTASLQTSD